MTNELWEKCWRWIEGGPCDGATNMAIDEALLLSVIQGSAPPTIRLYSWSSPVLSLGYLQNARAEVNVELCRALGINIVRRPTGGKAVLHDRELTYSVVAPEGLFPAPKSVLSTYRVISRALISGLAHLGVEAQMVPPREGHVSSWPSRESGRDKARPSSYYPAACFAIPSAYEVAVDGKKIIGSAQKRQNNCVLQQGSILLALDRKLLFSLLQGPPPLPPPVHGGGRGGEKMVSVHEILGREVDFAEVATAMREGFRLAWGVSLREGELEKAESERAEELRREKYARDEWNLKR